MNQEINKFGEGIGNAIPLLAKANSILAC